MSNLFYFDVKKYIATHLQLPMSLRKILTKDAVKSLESSFISSYKKQFSEANVIKVDLPNLSSIVHSNLNIEELKTIRLPFDNFFIETVEYDNKLGIHIIKESDNTLTVYVYTAEKNDILPLMLVINPDRLPRFYVGCFDKCNNHIPTDKLGNFGKECCMRTPRTCHCAIGKLAYISLQIVVIVLKCLNKSPKFAQGNSTTQRRNLNSLHNSIYIPKQQFIYLKSVNTTSLSTFKSNSNEGQTKSPHNRRGHYRNYKNGKRIWIRPTQVNGGKIESN